MDFIDKQIAFLCIPKLFEKMNSFKFKSYILKTIILRLFVIKTSFFKEREANMCLRTIFYLP